MNDRLITLFVTKATASDGRVDFSKFAELIVRECAGTAADYVMECEGVDFGLEAACYEHFGLNE